MAGEGVGGGVGEGAGAVEVATCVGTAASARLWLEEVVEGDEEDHSWERVCLACREPIPGLEIPA